MNINNLLGMMSVEELKNFEDEIRKGKIKELINQKSQQTEQKTCAVCGEKFEKITGLSIEFGSPEFRRRAHFCAMDCMEYFLESMKKKNTGYY